VLRKARIDTLVIQHLVGRSAQDTFYNHEEALALVREAPVGTTIFVGLVYDAEFDPLHATAEELQTAAVEDVQTATEFWDQIPESDRSRIGGWYVAREISNVAVDSTQARAVGRYLTHVARRLPARPRVLISPYFVPPSQTRPELLGPAATAELLTSLTHGSGVTDVLLQDGVGARDMHPQGCRWALETFLPISAEYARAVEEELPPDITFWTNVEAFGPKATPNRLQRQFALVPPKRRIIVFAYRDCVRTGVCTPVRRSRLLQAPPAAR
jgi:hypothetical protein